MHSADIAFYFAHWVTDLAGAEPIPLRGAVKFVLKFPQAVFTRLMGSMPEVQRLAASSPTQLVERFLKKEWAEMAELGGVPAGVEAIALMRLAVMSQTPKLALAVRDAFAELPTEQREMLATEMAMTGTAEPYHTHHLPRSGPALLLYYAPHFLRHCHATSGTGADADADVDAEARAAARASMACLSEVYRAARSLFGTDSTRTEDHATVYMDAIKDCDRHQIFESYAEGRCWAVVKVSQHEAKVQRFDAEELPTMVRDTNVELLHLWKRVVLP